MTALKTMPKRQELHNTLELPLVKKQCFHMDNMVTRTGKILKDVNIGWESYGELNDRRDNVILICHQYSSNSHAAGKYNDSDEVFGYWDSIIGPDKAIDTRKYFVIAVDSLINLNSKDGVTITTGPSSINPDTQQPYGLNFPVVTIPDFVNVQYALLESLNITQLQCVIGFSMGAMQAYQWAASHPKFVSRIIPISGTANMSNFACFSVEGWTAPIKLDPAWNGGNYYHKEEPSEAVTHSFLNLYRQALHPNHVASQYSDGWDDGESAYNSIHAELSVQKELRVLAENRAVNTTDANNMLYMTRVLQLFKAGTIRSSVEPNLSNIRADTLIIQVRTDLIFPVDEAKRTVEKLKTAGTSVKYFELDSDGGHLGAISDIDRASDAIRQHLERAGN